MSTQITSVCHGESNALLLDIITLKVKKLWRVESTCTCFLVCVHFYTMPSSPQNCALVPNSSKTTHTNFFDFVFDVNFDEFSGTCTGTSTILAEI